NDTYKVVNALLKNDIQVYREPGSGDFVVEATSRNTGLLESLVQETGIRVIATDKHAPDATPVRPVRIGLWDNYGGSMPSGWIRWISEQYGFNATQIFAPEID